LGAHHKRLHGKGVKARRMIYLKELNLLPPYEKWFPQVLFPATKSGANVDPKCRPFNYHSLLH
jgi:hypothetical protein